MIQVSSLWKQCGVSGISEWHSGLAGVAEPSSRLAAAMSALKTATRGAWKAAALHVPVNAEVGFFIFFNTFYF